MECLERIPLNSVSSSEKGFEINASESKHFISHQDGLINVIINGNKLFSFVNSS